MSDGMFDPSQPEMLLYVPDATGNWELVGTAFMLPHILKFSHNHPEAFAGPLDNWHLHYNECVGGGPGFAKANRDECQARGGDWFPAVGWMIHVYVWVDNPWGVFHNWNPNIPPVIPASSITETYPKTTLEEGQVALTIKNFGFALREAQLKKGETAIWTNADGVPHTVTLGFEGKAEKGFDSSYIAPGQSFVRKFDQPGEYGYTCTLHPNMNGTIIVNK
jgi:plastocyanin